MNRHRVTAVGQPGPRAMSPLSADVLPPRTISCVVDPDRVLTKGVATTQGGWLAIQVGRTPSRRKDRRLAQLRPRLERVEDRCLLSTITVDTAVDEDDHTDDTLSFREALEVSNGDIAVSSLSPSAQAQVSGPLSSPNTIDFDIPGTGPFTINLQPNQTLLYVRVPTIIDGYSQPGASPNTLALGDNAKLMIEVSGLDLGIYGGNSRVSGLVIDGGGIQITTKGSNAITGNFIGTDVSGTTVPGNTSRVEIDYSDVFQSGEHYLANLNTIGGTTPGDRNVISGGVIVQSYQTDNLGKGNLIQGNYIGIDATGTKAQSNAGAGIFADDPFETIGGTTSGAGNLVSGNSGGGIIAGSNALIQGNLVGTDATGSVALGNGNTGYAISAGFSSTIGGANAGNVVAGFQGDTAVSVGSQLDKPGVLIQDNFIGTDASGTKPLGNGFIGLALDTRSGEGPELTGRSGDAIIGNVVSSNQGDGIVIDGFLPNDVIQGNFIGTDPTGTIDLGNGQDGIDIQSANGTSGAPALIGGSAAGARNVIAFNGFEGITTPPGAGIEINRNSIFSNTYLGIDVAGYDPILGTGQAPPSLSFLPGANGTVTLSGTLQAPADTEFHIQIFANDPVSPPLVAQGKTFVEDIAVTTDPNGLASFSLLDLNQA
jgi:hypothetical protein